MKNENRGSTPKTDADEESADKAEDFEEAIQEDCFEYKLVGVNVHSGSANAGHYWSYINTARGFEGKEDNDPKWPETENEPWMEFNDSTVKDFKFENLKDECYGDKPGIKTYNTMSAWSLGTKYGKSGYMLFYERRKKKPIKIVVPKEEALDKTDLHHDPKTDEYIKFIDYRQSVDNEKASTIFSQVLEDNTKYSFENDVYSQEFFVFVLNIL